MECRIGITGAGIISALGVGLEETYRALIEERCAIAPIRFLETLHKDMPCGEVPYSLSELKSMCNLPQNKIIPRSSALGILAARQALEQARITKENKLAFINATTVGGVDITEQHITHYLSDNTHDKYLYYHTDGVETEIIAKALEADVLYCDVLSTACSAAANAIALAAMLIQSGRYDIVLAGGSESLSRYHLNGFNSLMILDSKPCRPFSADRAGLNLGEGAGFIVLESEKSLKNRGVEPMAYLTGFGNSCDAFHQTASSAEGEGALLAMKMALNMSGLQPNQIDYINAHGTGTSNNDTSEAAAIRRLFGPNALPPISSTKSAHGHPTSAAAAIEAIIALISIERGIIPANLNFSGADAQVGFTPNLHCQKGVKVTNVLSNSFGFGGNDSSLIFSAPHQQSQQPQELQLPLPQSTKIFLCGVGTAMGEDSEYKKFFPPLVARRLSGIIKRSYVAAQEAVKESGIELPEAIVTGTGLGCVEDTESFMLQMIANNEQLLNPSKFISSTPNTIGSQIALMSGNHGWNSTHVNDNFAFEGTMLEAFLLLKNNLASSALVVGAEQVTPNLTKLLERCTLWQGNNIKSGAAAFVLSDKPLQSCMASVEAISIHPALYGSVDFEAALRSFLSSDKTGTTSATESISKVLLSFNSSTPEWKIAEQLLQEAKLQDFKPQSGEWFTAVSYAMAMGAKELADSAAPQNMLIINGRNGSYSFILLSSYIKNN